MTRRRHGSEPPAARRARDGTRAAKKSSRRSVPRARPPAPRSTERTVGKRVTFDAATWQTIDLLGRDSMKSFQELADEAFRDLLVKHGRPDTLRGALRESARRTRRKNQTAR